MSKPQKYRDIFSKKTLKEYRKEITDKWYINCQDGGNSKLIESIRHLSYRILKLLFSTNSSFDTQGLAEIVKLQKEGNAVTIFANHDGRLATAVAAYTVLSTAYDTTNNTSVDDFAVAVKKWLLSSDVFALFSSCMNFFAVRSPFEKWITQKNDTQKEYIDQGIREKITFVFHEGWTPRNDPETGTWLQVLPTYPWITTERSRPNTVFCTGAIQTKGAWEGNTNVFGIQALQQLQKKKEVSLQFWAKHTRESLTEEIQKTQEDGEYHDAFEYYYTHMDIYIIKNILATVLQEAKKRKNISQEEKILLSNLEEITAIKETNKDGNTVKKDIRKLLSIYLTNTGDVKEDTTRSPLLESIVQKLHRHLRKTRDLTTDRQKTYKDKIRQDFIIWIENIKKLQEMNFPLWNFGTEVLSRMPEYKENI